METTPNLECQTCIEAKTHKFTIPKESNSKHENIGDLIFSDVWGPARITGIRNKRYFVSFTDAKTQRTNVYLMEHKKEALEHFQHY